CANYYGFYYLDYW
nr:immunoglobulin heavy chain junction region [Mus musculus]